MPRKKKGKKIVVSDPKPDPISDPKPAPKPEPTVFTQREKWAEDLDHDLIESILFRLIDEENIIKKYYKSPEDYAKLDILDRDDIIEAYGLAREDSGYVIPMVSWEEAFVVNKMVKNHAEFRYWANAVRREEIKLRKIKTSGDVKLKIPGGTSGGGVTGKRSRKEMEEDDKEDRIEKYDDKRDMKRRKTKV